MGISSRQDIDPASIFAIDPALNSLTRFFCAFAVSIHSLALETLSRVRSILTWLGSRLSSPALLMVVIPGQPPNRELRKRLRLRDGARKRLSHRLARTIGALLW